MEFVLAKLKINKNNKYYSLHFPLHYIRGTVKLNASSKCLLDG